VTFCWTELSGLNDKVARTRPPFLTILRNDVCFQSRWIRRNSVPLETTEFLRIQVHAIGGRNSCESSHPRLQSNTGRRTFPDECIGFAISSEDAHSVTAHGDGVRDERLQLVFNAGTRLVNLRSLFGGNLLPDFARGVHPPQNKSRTCDLAIETLPVPGIVTIPLLQHAGAPAECVVNPRQQVELGELIGRRVASGLSANIHASVAGTVQALTAVPLPNGRRSLAVPIKSAASDDDSVANASIAEQLFGGDWPDDEIAAAQPVDILEAVTEAGIVGMGGAAFPTDVKLRTTRQRPVETLLVNGCECEPFLTSDDRLMREFPAAIVAGARLAQKACGARQIVLAVESNKPTAVDALSTAADHCSDFEIRIVNTKYPMGGERQLIPAVFQREVPTGGLPLDLGIAVINVATTAAIAGAVLRDRALTHRIVTVTGGGVCSPKNLLVPIGASFESLIDFCGGLTADARRVLAGGPMMGFTVTDLSAPVTKGTGGITVLSAAEIDAAERTACIRCGRCLDVCPLGLAPTRIAHAAKAGDLVLAQLNHLAACCECGCCAYDCPARIPLVQYIRAGKVELARSRIESQAR